LRRVGAFAREPLLDAPGDAEPRRIRFDPPLRSLGGVLRRGLISPSSERLVVVVNVRHFVVFAEL